MERAHTSAESRNIGEQQSEERALKVQYLEIVTPAVAETCDALAQAHDVDFSDPIAQLGNARTALLKDGGRIGVRAPLRESEEPVVRPYALVDDIEAAVKAAEKSGAKVALPPMEIPGQGTFSIYILGGIEHGLWQL
jgi:predicted enzyme related to lactoylglutathione lyase